MTPVRYFQSPPPFDPWANAKRRYNQIVTVRLKDKETGAIFLVASYHMPCLFGSPEKRQTMVIHASLAAQHVHNISNGDPYMLVGDFNFKPVDASYALVTKGHISKDHEDFPPQSPTAALNFDVLNVPKLDSAYMLKNGVEPDFTNHAQVKGGDLFTETLDFMFLSPQWEVDGVDLLAPCETLGGPFPDREQPSDHILIAGNFLLAAEQ